MPAAVGDCEKGGQAGASADIGALDRVVYLVGTLHWLAFAVLQGLRGRPLEPCTWGLLSVRLIICAVCGIASGGEPEPRTWGLFWETCLSLIRQAIRKVLRSPP